MTRSSIVLTGVSIAREVAGPLNEGAGLVLTAGDGEKADGADNTGVAQSGLSGDDRVGDIVVDGLPSISMLFAMRQAIDQQSAPPA